jgi:hypothetical protein
LSGNYLVGGIVTGVVDGWKRMTVSNNTFINPNGFFAIGRPAETLGTYVWSNNKYLGVPSDSPVFYHQDHLVDFASWRTISGLDATSQFNVGHPTTTHVFVKPSPFTAGRGNVVVYNWANQASVSINLAGIIPVGKTFEIRDVQNFFGVPVFTGVYIGTPVFFPLITMLPAAAVGAAPVNATGPNFSAYVVLLK